MVGNKGSECHAKIKITTKKTTATATPSEPPTTTAFIAASTAVSVALVASPSGDFNVCGISGGVIALVDYLHGLYLTAAPEAEPDRAQDGSLPILQFTVKNRSAWFDLKDVGLLCYADLITYADNAGHTFDVSGIAQFSPVNITRIGADKPPVNYSCDLSQVMKSAADGSINLMGLQSKPGVAIGPLHIASMCLRISATYRVIGFSRSYESSTFEWIKTPTNHRWMYGPVAQLPSSEFHCGSANEEDH